MAHARASALLLAGAVLLGAGGAAAEPPAAAADAKKAVALNDEATALYEQGRYRAAVEKLEEALRLDPGGKDLVYNIAVIHEKLAEVDEAIASYRRYLEMERDAKARARVQNVVRRLEGVRRERADQKPAGASAPVSSTPAPEAVTATRPIRPWVIATGGGAAASVLAGSILAIVAAAKDPGSDARTGGGVTVQDLTSSARSAHTHAQVADAFFILGAAAAATTVILYLVTPRTTTIAAVSSRVAVGPGGMRVRF